MSAQWALVCELAGPDAVPADWDGLVCSDVRTMVQWTSTSDPQDRYRLLQLAAAEMGVAEWQCPPLDGQGRPQ
jgi:hypothetical protein